MFGGITESILATAEFSNLLAPLQKAIRESVQSSIEGGIFDQGAFTSTVLPAIEAILSRAEMLRPLIDELQRLASRSINAWLNAT